MTRFARASRKTSLEATPWHELVNSGGDGEGSKTMKGSTDRDNTHPGGKKIKSSDKKRKAFSVDEYSGEKKISKKSQYQEEDVEVFEKGENGSFKVKKDGKKWKKTVNADQDTWKLMRTKKGLGNFGNKGTQMNKSLANPTSREKKLEARRKRRAKGKICFHCRQTGHLVSECPLAKDTEIDIGHCYKCGSSEHTTKNCKKKSKDALGTEFPFAKCFICGENGHIAKACPDNPKGLYPNGGGCKMCGSVEHFRRDCPQLQKQSKGSSTGKFVHSTKNTKGHYSADAEMEDKEESSVKAPKKKEPRVVKF